MTSPQDSVGESTFSRRLDSNRRSIKRHRRRSVRLYPSSTLSFNPNSSPQTDNMKFTTIITALFTLGFGADMAAAACSGCDMKVCSGKNLGGRCKTGCYPFKKVVAINGEGLNAPVRSAKTDTDCECTLAVESEYVSRNLIARFAALTNACIGDLVNLSPPTARVQM